MLIMNAAAVLMLLATNLLVASCSTPRDISSAITPTSQQAAVPTLRILSPKDSDTIVLPSRVRFTVNAFTVAKGEGQVKAFAAGSADSPVVALEISDEPGVASLPSNKFLTGRRDLTFALANADGTLLENPEARVTVRQLTIQGGR